jgi:hypothetical protein
VFRLAANRSARLAAAALWMLSAALLLRIAGIGALDGFIHGLQRRPLEAALAGSIGLVAVVLAALLMFAPSRRVHAVSVAWGVTAGIGGCVLFLNHHESAMLVIVLAVLTTTVSALTWRSS